MDAVLRDKVYEALLQAFLRDISDGDRQRCRAGYLDYLHKTYDARFDRESADDVNALASMCVQMEKISHLDKSEEAKLAFLFPDPVFLELQRHALRIAELAAKKKQGQRAEQVNREEEEAQLSDLFSRVSQPFQPSAQRLNSEALMDLRYLCGDEQVMGFRTGHVHQAEGND
ncbi:MAG: hypothetical protein IJ083_05350 [Clostridia bacterium]|nr:hypothetical protein [Clostridia bacterium]